MIPVINPEQLRAWDAAAAEAGTELGVLMERAGAAVVAAIRDRFGAVMHRGVLVLCGSGNNGGDGWVAARLLHVGDVPVWVVESGAAPSGIAADVRKAALDAGVPLLDTGEVWPDVALFVDALLGAGATGPLRGSVQSLLARLRNFDSPVLAVDAPSGLDLGTGADNGAVAATVSVTFGGLRRGHLIARDTIGDLVIADIGMPAPPAEWPTLVTRQWAARQLTPLPVRAHKGTRGRVVVIGGAPAMVGAARLASRAAFGTGAGLVHAIVPAASLMVMRTAEPDVQVSEACFDELPDDALQQLVQRADAVVLGPGMGRGGSTQFVLAVIEHAKRVVVDADALVALCGHVDELHALAATREVVLTPHIGEFRMFFPDCPHDPAADPWAAAAYAAESSGAVVLLKGVPTVITMSESARTVSAGNPGLATGGSGDVLSGIIGALLAQQLPAPDAAAIGAQALGDAADHAARRHTVRAMRPMDVVSALPDVWRTWSRIEFTDTELPMTLPKPRTT